MTLCRVCCRSLVALMLLASLPTTARAQTPVPIPNDAGQTMLIRNTLAAVNHGNLTGNYTVLRDLASDRFRKDNSAADLAIKFSALRSQRLDLSPILVTQPKLTNPPALDDFRGRLQLVGYVPTNPQAVQFNLVFQLVEAGWMIDEVTLAVAPADAVVRTDPLRTSQPAPTPGQLSPSPAISSR